MKQPLNECVWSWNPVKHPKSREQILLLFSGVIQLNSTALKAFLWISTSSHGPKSRTALAHDWSVGFWFVAAVGTSKPILIWFV